MSGARLIGLSLGAWLAMISVGFGQNAPTIRDINAISAANVRNLERGGKDLTEDNIRELVGSQLFGDDVLVTAVVLSDPRNSGASEVIDGRVAAVHFFVRDLASDSLGHDGMGIQVIDDDWEQNGVLDLRIGDVVVMLARVWESEHGVHLRPREISRLGRHEALGIGPEILTPTSGLRVDDLNVSFGDGSYQANWSAVARLRGSPVCIERAFVESAAGSDRAGRHDWSVSTEHEARLYTSDLSNRYRSDTRQQYPPDFNLRETAYSPPRAGSTVRLCGFVVLRGFNDPDGVSRPLAPSTGSMLSLAPMEDSDVSVLEFPPAVESVDRPDRVLNSRESFVLEARVSVDPARTLRRVDLTYQSNRRTATRSMAPRPDGRWVSIIPPVRADGQFVSYRVDAQDDAGATAGSDWIRYRALDDGIDSIEDIQRTFDDQAGDSPFASLDVPVDITAVVQSQPRRSGMVAIRDDTLLSQWSGIVVTSFADPSYQPMRGDIIRISRARVTETNGMTTLDAVVTTLEGGFGQLRDYVTVDAHSLAASASAEAYEGMLIRIEDASILQPLGDERWLAWSGDVSDDFAISTSSASIDDGRLGIWQTYPFVRGVWLESGDGYALFVEVDADIPEVVNVAAEADLPAEAGPGIRSVYPTPFTRTTEVSFALPASGPAIIEVFDIMGRRVEVLETGRLSSGTHSVRLDAGNWAPGPYLLRIEFDGGADHKTILKID